MAAIDREQLDHQEVIAEVLSLVSVGKPIEATDFVVGWIDDRLEENAFHEARDLLDAIDVADIPTQVLTAVATLTWHAKTVLGEHRERYLDRMFENFASVRGMDAARLGLPGSLWFPEVVAVVEGQARDVADAAADQRVVIAEQHTDRLHARRPGTYVVEGAIDPATVATVATWCADQDVLINDIRGDGPAYGTDSKKEKVGLLFLTSPSQSLLCI